MEQNNSTKTPEVDIVGKENFASTYSWTNDTRFFIIFIIAVIAIYYGYSYYSKRVECLNDVSYIETHYNSNTFVYTYKYKHFETRKEAIGYCIRNAD